MPVIVDTPLTELEPGSEGLISRVRTHDHDKLRYIAELGLVPGEEILLIGCAPFRGPLRVRMNRHEQVIGYELASSLWIELDE